jgi:hypothetical protein
METDTVKMPRSVQHRLADKCKQIHILQQSYSTRILSEVLSVSLSSYDNFESNQQRIDLERIRRRAEFIKIHANSRGWDWPYAI